MLTDSRLDVLVLLATLWASNDAPSLPRSDDDPSTWFFGTDPLVNFFGRLVSDFEAFVIDFDKFVNDFDACFFISFSLLFIFLFLLVHR